MNNVVINERIRVQIRSEFLNAFNHANFGDLNTTFTSALLSRITSTDPRDIQLGQILS